MGFVPVLVPLYKKIKLKMPAPTYAVLGLEVL